MDTRATPIRKEIWAKGTDLAKFARIKNLNVERLRNYTMGHVKNAPEIEKVLLEFGVSKEAIRKTRELYRKNHPLKENKNVH